MTANGIFQVIFYLVVALALVKPLGNYMAQVYMGNLSHAGAIASFENWIYRCCGIRSEQEMTWQQYAVGMLLLNFAGILLVYAIQRLQIFLPLNPQHFSAVPPDLAFNTAISFVTNTNWQNYGGESTLSYLTQMAALTVQNFLSAASGMAVLIALIRGLQRHETKQLGNFWVDMTRGVLYIFLPLSVLLALLLASQGVIQNLHTYQTITPLQTISYQQSTIQNNNSASSANSSVNTQITSSAPVATSNTNTQTNSTTPTTSSNTNTQTNTTTQTATPFASTQTIPMGPAASQIAIKQLGTNGGGFFNVNSAHPFENPTPISNFLEMLAIPLIPMALCYTFGVMVCDTKQGWAVLFAMMLIFLPLAGITITAEQMGNPVLTKMGVNQTAMDDVFPGGNMEGKETRFGIVNSALWASITTATANGSVNSMHDSFTPLGGLVPMWLMQFAEVIFGGVGSGLAQMIIFIIIAVFVAGLMVGRTPEYLGKKIESYEMKMTALVILIMPLTVLICAAVSAVITAGTSALGNSGAHGFSEILYAFTSMGNNNGSAFAGLNGNTHYYNSLGGIAMLIGRYWIAVPVLAIAGSLAQKKTIPMSQGTLPTHTPLFVLFLVSVVLIVGALTFFPALALGPIVEQLMMVGN
jgi:K+-transporting ATPase ATPase A chain